MASIDFETIDEEDITEDDKVVELRGALLELAEGIMYYDGPPLVREYLLEGPAGCVAGDTRFDGCSQTIRELCEQGIAPIVQTLGGPTQAEIPFRKGEERLYRFTTENGRSNSVTLAHRFRARFWNSPHDDWIPSRELFVDDLLLTSDGWSRIVSVEDAGVHDFYDLHVPGEEHYLADGIYSHNTGKSTAWMYLLYLLCRHVPGVRFLVVRKYRRSLGESFCEPFEKFVCTGDEPGLGIGYASRTTYELWDNGSAIVLGGLDQPGNLYSTMFDGIVIQEAWQVVMEKIDPFYRALRRFHTPLNFMILDTNPRHRRHPLNARGNNGKVIRLKSVHEDNPRYFNVDGTKTPEGAAYMEGLDALPEGSNLWLWLRKGEWSGAEGLVYPDFSEERNCIDPPAFLHGTTLRDWKQFEIDYFVIGIDWGWRDPGCMQVWGISESGLDGIPNAGFLVAEWYHSKKGIDWWVERAVEMYFEFPPVRAIVCDHDPDAINRVNIALGSRGVNGSRRDEVPRIARNADKEFDRGARVDLAGVDLVRQLIGGDRNAPPRLFIVNGFERVVDPELKKQHLPLSFLDEIWGYIYRQQNENGDPLPFNGAEQIDPSCNGKDNALDVTRYVMNFSFRRNLHPAPAQTKYKPGTIGWATREDEKLFPKQSEDIVTRKRREMLERMDGKRR